MAGLARIVIARTTLIAAALGCSHAVTGQEPADVSDTQRSESVEDTTRPNEIVVTGERPYDEATLEKAVGDINMRGRVLYRPIRRYNSPVCLHVAGLKPAVAQAIKDRIEQHAEMLELPLGREGCKVNAMVVSIAEPKAFIDGFRKTQPWAFSLEGDQLIRASLRRKDPAIVWHATIAGGPDPNVSSDVGAGLMMVPGSNVDDFGVPIRVLSGNSETGRTILETPITLSRTNGTVVFDANRLDGFTIAQVADYAAMRLFGDTQPQVEFSDDAAYSIISMFEAGADGAAPSLTLLDRAYLQGIYTMKPSAGAYGLERSTKIAYRKLLRAACEEMPECGPDTPLAKDQQE